MPGIPAGPLPPFRSWQHGADLPAGLPRYSGVIPQTRTNSTSRHPQSSFGEHVHPRWPFPLASPGRAEPQTMLFMASILVRSLVTLATTDGYPPGPALEPSGSHPSCSGTIHIKPVGRSLPLLGHHRGSPALSEASNPAVHGPRPRAADRGLSQQGQSSTRAGEPPWMGPHNSGAIPQTRTNGTFWAPAVSTGALAHQGGRPILLSTWADQASDDDRTRGGEGAHLLPSLLRGYLGHKALRVMS
jgi:hypothetical protein